MKSISKDYKILLPLLVATALVGVASCKKRAPDSQVEFIELSDRGLVAALKYKSIRICLTQTDAAEKRVSSQIQKEKIKDNILRWIDPLRKISSEPLANAVEFTCSHPNGFVDIGSSKRSTARESAGAWVETGGKKPLMYVVDNNEGLEVANQEHVFTHEIGHMFGLGDTYTKKNSLAGNCEPGQPPSVMCGSSYAARSTTLMQDDILGVQAVYRHEYGNDGIPKKVGKKFDNANGVMQSCAKKLNPCDKSVNKKASQCTCNYYRTCQNSQELIKSHCSGLSLTDDIAAASAAAGNGASTVDAPPTEADPPYFSKDAANGPMFECTDTWHACDELKFAAGGQTCACQYFMACYGLAKDQAPTCQSSDYAGSTSSPIDGNILMSDYIDAMESEKDIDAQNIPAMCTLDLSGRFAPIGNDLPTQQNDKPAAPSNDAREAPPD